MSETVENVLAVSPPRVRRFQWFRDAPVLVKLSATLLLIVGIMAVTGPLLAPYDPSETGLAPSLQGPSMAHPLGTDDLGRDVLSRVIAGARSSVVGPAIIAVVCIALSTMLALVSAYRGGMTDAFLGRFADLLFSLPALLVAIVAIGMIGGGYAAAIGILIVLNLPQNYRIMRSVAQEQRGLPYVESAEAMGASPIRVMARHIMPNLAQYIIALTALRFTYSIVELSSLSFLGLGVPAGAADWGRMLAENRSFIQLNSWASLAPALALMFTAAAASLFGDYFDDRRAKTEIPK